jgi:hypothetical protein
MDAVPLDPQSRFLALNRDARRDHAAITPRSAVNEGATDFYTWDVSDINTGAELNCEHTSTAKI